jgi:hypothetical protein
MADLTQKVIVVTASELNVALAFSQEHSNRRNCSCRTEMSQWTPVIEGLNTGYVDFGDRQKNWNRNAMDRIGCRARKRSPAPKVLRCEIAATMQKRSIWCLGCSVLCFLSVSLLLVVRPIWN